MSYPLYKETTRPRSCTLTPDEINLVFCSYYTGVEVHDVDTHQLLRFVSREEIEEKWMEGKVIPFGKDGKGKFKPLAELHPARKAVFFAVRW